MFTRGLHRAPSSLLPLVVFTGYNDNCCWQIYSTVAKIIMSSVSQQRMQKSVSAVVAWLLMSGKHDLYIHNVWSVLNRSALRKSNYLLCTLHRCSRCQT